MGKKQKKLDGKSDAPAVQELVKAVLKDTDILQQSLLENDYDVTPKGLNLIIPYNELNSSEVARIVHLLHRLSIVGLLKKALMTTSTMVLIMLMSILL